MALNAALLDTDPIQHRLQDLSHQSISQACKLALLNAFWNRSEELGSCNNVPVGVYFGYFEDQCRLALHNWERFDISALKFSHLVFVAQMIHGQKPRGGDRFTSEVGSG
jgi:hypothetical protein